MSSLSQNEKTNNKVAEVALFVANLKNGIWAIGIPSWLYGITDRSFASFADGYLSPVEILHLLTASFFFLSWLILKPDNSLESEDTSSKSYGPNSNFYQLMNYPGMAQARMIELQDQHLISQEYILPFPYLCQIYHLLNLKHLESVHSFSLSNLRVMSVSHFQPTDIGGIIKFQTTLDSPMNALRIWRQPVVEALLVLHTPYTVELHIPVYGNKHITVIFNVLPLSENEHKLFIDIYSNLEWPRPLLQILLHFAACLTLFEDLPYLRRLAQRNVSRLVKASKTSSHETMLLFKRFVDLYGASVTSPQLQSAEN